MEQEFNMLENNETIQGAAKTQVLKIHRKFLRMLTLHGEFIKATQLKKDYCT